VTGIWRQRFAQYEDGAVLQPWAASAADGIAGELAAVMDLRLPLALRVRVGLAGSAVALVLADRHMRGTGPDGQQVRLSGSGATVVRRGLDGAWRIAADAWCLTREADQG
jgi:ketosteroid isomerase-like protein